MAKSDYYEVVERDVKEVPSGKGKEKSPLYENMLKDFLASGNKNWKIEWKKEKSPSFATARASLQKLTRKSGLTDKGKKTPAGKYCGQVRISGVKDFIYFERIKE